MFEWVIGICAIAIAWGVWKCSEHLDDIADELYKIRDLYQHADDESKK